MSQYKIDAEVVLKAASGRWDEVLSSLAPALRPALKAAPNHVACPIHGGENGFRFFKDYRVSGSCICNTCGAFDGIHILMAVNSWNFFTALKAVNDFLRVPEGISPESQIETIDGKVTFIGMSKLKSGSSCFNVVLNLQDGTERRLWGKDLQRACAESELAVGDNARLSLLGTRTFTYKGRECQQKLWSARKMPSDRELEEKTQKASDEALRRANAINDKWISANPVRSYEASQKPLLTYLANRGITPARGSRILRNMRFLPAETYVDEHGKTVGKYPCMVCAVRNVEGKLITLHRTYLTQDGVKLAGYGPAKKLMALPEGETINGAFISFGEVNKEDGILCIAEGVETALSVAVATGYPCVSSISAHGMTAVELPKVVKAVFIFADRDKSQTGQNAAIKLRDRLLESRIPSVICLPSPDMLVLNEKGVDWNDVIRLRGPSAFPFYRELTCESF